MGLDMQSPLLLTLILGVVLLGWSDAARDQTKRSDTITPVPSPLSTSGWRPIAMPPDWSQDAKLRAGGASSHPVLSKVQAHLEAAEKKRVYAPAPPSILGSLSVFGHATVKAREPAKTKKKMNNLSESVLQGSESRLVYTSHLVPPPLPQLQHSTSVRFPDQLTEQQQSQYYLHHPGTQSQENFSDSLLVPPPQTPDHLSTNYYYNSPHITSYQSQKLGDFTRGIPLLEVPGFTHQIHHQYTANPHLYSQKDPQVQQQQSQSFATSNIEFIPHRKTPSTDNKGTLTPDKFTNSQYNDQPLQLAKPLHQSDKQEVKHKDSSFQDYFGHSSTIKNSEGLILNSSKKSNGGALDSGIILTPSTELLNKVKNTLSAGEIIHGQSFTDLSQYQTPSPVSELTVSSQRSPTDKDAATVVGFSLGVGSGQQETHSGSEQYLENPFVISQSTGERGRITRPYFREEHQASQDKPSSTKHRYPQLPTQRYPPDVIEVVEEVDHFLPTSSPVLNDPGLKETAGSEDSQAFNEVHPHQSRKPQIFPPSTEVQISEPEYVQPPETGEEQTLPGVSKTRQPSSRKPGNKGNRYPNSETEEVNTRPKHRRPAAVESEQVSHHSYHETQQANPPRTRRPGGYKRPQPVEEEEEEEQEVPRRPQHYRRRPANHQEPVRGGSESRRRPGTRTRVRPAAQYEEEDPTTAQQQDYYYQEQRKHYRRRKTTPAPQYIDVTGESSTAPTGEGDFYSSQYGSTATEDETQEDAPVTHTPYITTTTVKPRRGNPYIRNRGKDKYARPPTTPRTTTPAPETTTTSQPESAEEYVAQFHNDIFESPVDINTGSDLEKSVTQSPGESDESYTTFIIPTSTLPTTTTSSTTTTTTTTTTTESPQQTTEATAASTSSISRVRPRIRYGGNGTRPRFSVKDFQDKLRSPSNELGKAKPDEEVTTASPRVRYPTRIRGSYQYKRPEEESTSTTTAPEPTRGRYRPKESRYGSTRYRSSSTTTTVPPEVLETTERSKASSSRYRPGTGKYNTRYRATTELPASGPGEENTPRQPVRPKGVFSAVRRPYPLRTRTSIIKDSEDTPLDSDDSETSIQSQTITTTLPPAEITHYSSYINTEPSAILNTVYALKSTENDVIPITMTEKIDSTVEPEEEEDTEDTEVERHTTPSYKKPITTLQPDENTPSPSQRVADLTSSASLGGFFKTSVSTSNSDARRITMATEDPILPIEAFFPVRGNKKHKIR